MFFNLVDNILLWNNKIFKWNINIFNFILYKVIILNDKKVIKFKKKFIINKNLLKFLVILEVFFFLCCLCSDC